MHLSFPIKKKLVGDFYYLLPSFLYLSYLRRWVCGSRTTCRPATSVGRLSEHCTHTHSTRIVTFPVTFPFCTCHLAEVELVRVGQPIVLPLLPKSDLDTAHTHRQNFFLRFFFRFYTKPNTLPREKTPKVIESTGQ